MTVSVRRTGNSYHGARGSFRPFLPDVSDLICLVLGGSAAPLLSIMEINKEFLETLKSIDLSLKILAAGRESPPSTVLVDKKTVAKSLNVSAAFIDKLIFQGIVSNGISGLVERRHYCKLTPDEKNTANYRFNLNRILADSWQSFANYDSET